MGFGSFLRISHSVVSKKLFKVNDGEQKLFLLQNLICTNARFVCRASNQESFFSQTKRSKNNVPRDRSIPFVELEHSLAVKYTLGQKKIKV